MGGVEFAQNFFFDKFCGVRVALADLVVSFQASGPDSHS